MYKLTENEIADLIIAYFKKNPKWHIFKKADPTTKQHGSDIVIKGGTANGEVYTIECKGKSYSKSHKAINKEGWLNALGQLITRMTPSLSIKNGKYKGSVNRAYKYGLGLYWIGAQVALRRIPRAVAKALNLYVFSVNEKGYVKKFSPKNFGTKYQDREFFE
ncbi:MAG: hypothetical protein ACOQNV_00950 [Mycoplasmoidaceae bacterium]